eukprot:scaffold22445_cov73-Phaeocystis_antarctica.AAC.9
MASYLCYGSDFRKGEIVPPQARPPHDERYYAQRRVPDARTSCCGACATTCCSQPSRLTASLPRWARCCAGASPTPQCRLRAPSVAT